MEPEAKPATFINQCFSTACFYRVASKDEKTKSGVDYGLAWINLWDALRENGFSYQRFMRWQSQMGRKKRENMHGKVQPGMEGKQNKARVQSERYGAKIENGREGKQDGEQEIIPLNTWIAGWEALKRNGFPEFVKWTQLGREKRSQKL